jgi:hypothetical protein
VVLLKGEGDVSLIREGRDTYWVLVGRFEVHHLEDLSVDGRIILKWILQSRVEGSEV